LETFLLILTISTSAITGGSGIIPPFAIGSTMMVVIFSKGPSSGGS
jgi:hypothetical protein